MAAKETVVVKYFTVKELPMHPLCRIKEAQKPTAERSLSLGGLEIFCIAGLIGETSAHFKANDRVMGLVPASETIFDGTTEVQLDHKFLYTIPSELNPADCVAAVYPCISLYTAMYYKVRPRKGENVLILCSDVNTASLGFQVCSAMDLQVSIGYSHSSIEEHFRNSDDLSENCLIKVDLYNTKKLVENAKAKTCKKGFDIILDLSERSEDQHTAELSYSDVISCLAVMGHLVTTNPYQKLCEKHSVILHLKCASVHFLFEQSWFLSPLRIGHLQHIVSDVFEHLRSRSYRPVIGLNVEVKSLREKMIASNDKGIVVYRL